MTRHPTFSGAVRAANSFNAAVAGGEVAMACPRRDPVTGDFSFVVAVYQIGGKNILRYL